MFQSVQVNKYNRRNQLRDNQNVIFPKLAFRVKCVSRKYKPVNNQYIEFFVYDSPYSFSQLLIIFLLLFPYSPC